jgi:hypothetical protein
LSRSEGKALWFLGFAFPPSESLPTCLDIDYRLPWEHFCSCAANLEKSSWKSCRLAISDHINSWCTCKYPALKSIYRNQNSVSEYVVASVSLISLIYKMKMVVLRSSDASSLNRWLPVSVLCHATLCEAWCSRVFTCPFSAVLGCLHQILGSWNCYICCNCCVYSYIPPYCQFIADQIKNKGCQRGAVVRSMFEINISTCHLWGREFDSRSNPVIERVTLSDSVGFLRGLRFPPTLHYKLPNIVYWANNVLVDTQLSIQYSIFYFNQEYTCIIKRPTGFEDTLCDTLVINLLCW